MTLGGCCNRRMIYWTMTITGAARDLLSSVETFRLLRRLILGVYDPFDASRARTEAEGEARDLVYAVDRETYMDNLRSLVAHARELGARARGVDRRS